MPGRWRRKPSVEKTCADERERFAFYRLYDGIELHLLPGPSHVPLVEAERDAPARIGIALDPDEKIVAEPTYRESDICPVCGAPTDPRDSKMASLQPEYPSGFSRLIGVWVHPECFERCLPAGEQRGFPW